MVVRDARPERSAPAEHFYDAREAGQYSKNARMAQIQKHLAQRALHLLNLGAGGGGMLLDIGCGTGYSGRVAERQGHYWVGLDISSAMLAASERAGTRSDRVCHDMGDGLPFRRRVFDGAISISAVQWLCVSTKSGHRPRERLLAFMKGLVRCLRPGARAALQFYPEEPDQLLLVRGAALEAGFGGALVTDYPRSEGSKKFFLVLVAPSAPPTQPKPAEPGRAPGLHQMKKAARAGAVQRRGVPEGRRGASRGAHTGGRQDRGPAAGVHKRRDWSEARAGHRPASSQARASPGAGRGGGGNERGGRGRHGGRGVWRGRGGTRGRGRGSR